MADMVAELLDRLSCVWPHLRFYLSFSTFLYLRIKELSQDSEHSSSSGAGVKRSADEMGLEHEETPQKKVKKKADVRIPDLMEEKAGKYQKVFPKRSYNFEDATNEGEATPGYVPSPKDGG
jgi:hypothetical protein